MVAKGLFGLARATAMIRWYFWLAMLFAVPLAAVFVPWLFLGSGEASLTSTLAAVSVGIALSSLAIVVLGRRFEDDRGSPLPAAPRSARRTMAAALVSIPLLAWSGFCGCFGAGLVRVAFDEPGLDPVPPFSWADFLMLVGALVPGLLLAIYIAVSVRRGSEPTSDRRRGLCAQCGYDLRGLPVTEGGLKVCPECGATWRTMEAIENR